MVTEEKAVKIITMKYSIYRWQLYLEDFSRTQFVLQQTLPLTTIAGLSTIQVH
jgi:hypothetical protein